MNLLSLTEKEIAHLIESLAKNPEIKEDEKSPTLNWLQLVSATTLRIIMSERSRLPMQNNLAMP